MNHLLLAVFLFVAAGQTVLVAKDSLVVVATRYLQAQGVSHAHLYLYKEDGSFLRQLTKFEKGQDHDPLFSTDGKEIVFIRISDSWNDSVVETASKKPASLEYWQVSVKGGEPKRLTEVPDWYRAATNAEHFTFGVPNDWPTNKPIPGEPDKGWNKKFSNPPTQGEIDSLPVTKVTSPDGIHELILKLGPEDIGFNGPGNGAFYEIKNLKTGKSWRLGELPGFLGLTSLLHHSSHPEQVFLQRGSLDVVFFTLHLNSTDGDWCIALNLNQPSLQGMVCETVRASSSKQRANSSPEQGGYAIPIPLAGESCFLSVASDRYQPIPNSAKTANISYLVRFDASLKGTPYVALRTAPEFYGASVYRPDKSPVAMKIGQDIGEK